MSLIPSHRQLLKHPVTLRSPRPGLSAEDQKKLFGKFARLSSKPTGGENSTGLGLSIVKHLAQSFSGQVSLASRLGKGSTFTVKLPLTEGKKTSPAEIHPPFIVS